jgi:hypothetical protein
MEQEFVLCPSITSISLFSHNIIYPPLPCALPILADKKLFSNTARVACTLLGRFCESPDIFPVKLEISFRFVSASSPAF